MATSKSAVQSGATVSAAVAKGSGPSASARFGVSTSGMSAAPHVPGTPGSAPEKATGASGAVPCRISITAPRGSKSSGSVPGSRAAGLVAKTSPRSAPCSAIAICSMTPSAMGGGARTSGGSTKPSRLVEATVNSAPAWHAMQPPAPTVGLSPTFVKTARPSFCCGVSAFVLAPPSPPPSMKRSKGLSSETRVAW